MAEIFLEIRAKSYQRLCEELGIPVGEIWVEDLEHGLEIKIEEQSIARTADWGSIVSLTCTVISTVPTLVGGARWLYATLKKSQVADEVEIIRRESVPLTEATLLAFLEEAKGSNQVQQGNASASSSLTIAEQIQQLVVLHETGALTDEEFTAKKAELLARM
jgi:hypothetical protein